MQLIKLSEATAARRTVKLYLVDDTDGTTPETGLTLSGSDIVITKNGGSETSFAGSVTEKAQGEYELELTTTEVNAVGPLTIKVIESGVRRFVTVVQVVAFDPYDSVRMGQTALPNAAAEASGGLYTRGTGAGQLNQSTNGELASATTLLARLGPFTGNTAKNSAYGMLRAIANGTDGFESADLTKDDGDGVGEYIGAKHALSSIGGFFAYLFLPLGPAFTDAGCTTTSIVLKTPTVDGTAVSTIDNIFRDCHVICFSTVSSLFCISPIVSYDGSTLTATLATDRPLPSAPAEDDIVLIMRGTSTVLHQDGLSATAIATAAASKLADAILSRDVANVEDTAALDSLAYIILACRYWEVVTNTLTVNKTDGTTPFDTRTLATSSSADAVVGMS